MASKNSEYKMEFSCPNCNLRDRHQLAGDYFAIMLNRLDAMFEWTGLPDTIPEYMLERLLKYNGWCGIGLAPENAPDVSARGKLYAFNGGLGLNLDPYYRPTAIIMANPCLGSKTYTIGKDVVWAKNDSMNYGLAEHLARYAHLLASNDISINIAQVNTRMPFVLTAETTNEIDSAKAFLDDMEKGKIGIVKSSAFNNGIRPQATVNSSAGDYLKALIELHQYLKAQWSIDIGVSMNFQMKRERVNSAEVHANSPYLLPLVDEMLKFRREICSNVEAMFGEKWSVKLSSAWKLENLNQILDVDIKEVEAGNSRNLDKGVEVDDSVRTSE